MWIKLSNIVTESIITEKENAFGLKIVGTPGASQGKLKAAINTNGGLTYFGDGPVDVGTWHHVAATRHSAAGAIAVYVDGVLTGSGAGPTGPRTAPSSLRIGSIQMGADSGYLNGMIDEVRLYDRVLSLAEVKALSRVPAGLSAVLEPRTLHPNVF